MFGDGTGYVHRLFRLRAGRLVQAIPPVRHTGKDGFYLGSLHQGSREGIVTWTADPRDEAEAEPHPFVVRTWTWSSGKLTGPVQSETSQKYAAPDGEPNRADFVARAIGLPFRDQTGDVRSRFKDLFNVQDRVQRLTTR